MASISCMLNRTPDFGVMLRSTIHCPKISTVSLALAKKSFLKNESLQSNLKRKKSESARFCGPFGDGDFPTDDNDEFLVREALDDNDYMGAARRRAEIGWGITVNTYQGILNEIDEEFKVLKERDMMPANGNAYCCKCIVAVRKEPKEREEFVAGTLDLCISSLLLQGKPEAFPVAYITKLIVVRSKRRMGIATKMLRFAINVGRSIGVRFLFARVGMRDERAAKFLQKFGFEVLKGEYTHLLPPQPTFIYYQTTYMLEI